MNRFDALYDYSKSLFFFEHERNTKIRKQIHLLVGIYYSIVLIMIALNDINPQIIFSLFNTLTMIIIFFFVNILIIGLYLISITSFKYKDIQSPKYMLKHYNAASKKTAYINAGFSKDNSVKHWLSNEYSNAYNYIREVNLSLIWIKISIAVIDLIAFIYFILNIFLKGGLF